MRDKLVLRFLGFLEAMKYILEQPHSVPPVSVALDHTTLKEEGSCGYSSVKTVRSIVITEFVEMGERLGRFGAFVVRIVNDEAPRIQAIVAQDDPHTRHQELVPGNLAVSKHPGQSRQRIAAETGTFKARPADGVGYQNGGDTKREPGTLHGGHAVARIMRADRLVNGVDKGTHKGCRLSNHHSGPHGQSDSWQYHRDCIDSLHLTSTEGTSYNRMTVAGRAVYRGRMVQARCLELDRSTQLPLLP